MPSTLTSQATQAVINVNGVDQLKIKEDGKLEVRTAGTGDKDVCVMGQSKLTQATTVATTSGTFIEFAGIPVWAKRVTLSFLNMSTNGASQVLVHLGGPAYQATGYSASLATIAGSVANAAAPLSVGFPLSNGNAANIITGTITFVNMGGGYWSGSGSFSYNNVAAIGNSAGGVLLVAPGVLERVRIGTQNGTDLFDGGIANITWE